MRQTALDFLSALPQFEMDADDVPNMAFIPMAQLCQNEFNFAIIDRTYRDILADEEM